MLKFFQLLCRVCEAVYFSYLLASLYNMHLDMTFSYLRGWDSNPRQTPYESVLATTSSPPRNKYVREQAIIKYILRNILSISIYIPKKNQVK